MRPRLAIAGLFLLTLGVAAAASAAPPVLSLDQCADQYVLALSPRGAIAGLSNRARNRDSYLADRAAGLPLRRADAESALAAAPRVVVRYWGGEPGLVAALVRRGVRVVTLEDADDFAGVRRNIRAVAAALGQARAGETLIVRMDQRLAASRGAWGGQGALYLTPGGATAGRRTLIDAILRAAGLANVAGGVGYHEVSLERLTLAPPSALVEGFFDGDAQAVARWSLGRHQALRRWAAGRTLVSLPGALLGCPAWFAADAAAMIADKAPKLRGG